MAGSYPDVPGYRFAYDKDGTTVLQWSNDSPSEASPSDVIYMQRDYQDRNLIIARFIVLFPEKRNITGIFVQCNYSFNTALEYSYDTTSGLDGSWSSTSTFSFSGSADKVLARTNTQSLSINSIRGLRLNSGNRIRRFHLYGSIATSESPDRLRIVDMSGDDIAAQLDFGDIRQRNNVTKQFKVVNNSSTKTANNITITMETNPDASPTLIGQYQLSVDNTAFANAINIGNLNPGQSSATLYLKDTIANNAQLGPWTIRLVASANTWS